MAANDFSILKPHKVINDKEITTFADYCTERESALNSKKENIPSERIPVNINPKDLGHEARTDTMEPHQYREKNTQLDNNRESRL